MARLRQFSYDFGVNERIPINIVGNVVRCVTGQEIFEIEPDEFERVQLQEGLGMSFERNFKKMVVINGSVAQTIKLYIGDGSILDSRLYGSLGVTSKGNNELVDVADQTINSTETDTIPANSDRSNILIQASFSNSGASADFLRVGPDAGSARGIELTPGASYRFFTSDEIKIYSPANGNVYRYIEERNT